MNQTSFRPGLIAAGIAFLVTVAVGYFADHQNRAVYREQARADVAESLGQVRAELESNINSNIQLVRGLVAVIAMDPDIDQARFERIASALIGEHSQLRNIAAAPDLVIQMMYPLAGNERALGLNYATHPTQRDGALAALEARQMMLAGPVDLVQGGRGFIGRFPVFVNSGEVDERVWGLISAVIDVDRLYAASGLFDEERPIDLVLMGRDADLSDTSVFFGDAQILGQNPVFTEVSLPNGAWRIAAIPRGGWKETPPNAARFRGLIVLAAFLVLVPIAMAGHFYDQHRDHVRELGRRENDMRLLSQRLELALETSKIGVWELNLTTGELRWDDRMKELYGIPSDVTPNAVDHWEEKLHPKDREQAIKEFQQAIASRGTYHSVFRVMEGESQERWIRTIGASHIDASGHQRILGVNWDISADVELKTKLIQANKDAKIRNRELEEARVQMEHNSLHDSLTNLPNRRFLDDRVLNDDVDNPPTALIHIDLDRFKHINDTLGHAAGDAMLVHAANVLRENTREGDFVARVGGDEFVIATTQPVDQGSLAKLASRVIEQMRQPVPYKDHKCRFGASIGIAINGGGGKAAPSQLLVDADLALYRAKKRGRNRYEFFDASLKAEIVSNKMLADEILTGLERREFLPYFQPQFDTQSLDIVGVEALARWHHPIRGVLAPDSFLDTADELNVVPLIDRAILEETLWQAARWQAAGIHIPKKSVNVSAGQLQDPELIDRLDDLPIKRGELSFELLESIFLDDQNTTVASNIDQLTKRGIAIEIDDFGTGYASIISLLQLRPARLKIERRLIAPIATSTSQRQLVASIIEIGKSLGISVVAEGVETFEHVAVLRDLGCDVLQGFAFAAPMPSEKLIDFVRENRWRDAA
ncbi:MAG: EAL domain-containing protein [Rhizobiales bacterium]|nr:EAL domain-containing protein [Hyphomicrobiales bacterium]MBO6700026.1 EAL domain-containing protein [Hyphomicrobiales bacterium]MBO6737809.1 EAL domain-containing protein [Hyphomicrobiales bacterium]MBO6913134.1 EAL domain-containing protein [Hyphomicrobiales bacterium]MBO6954178.1 EAL domain-containing protein [Hyphomicrobiales bacterium]